MSGGMDLWMTVVAISIAILLILLATQVQAQTFTVLHNFTAGDDGSEPLVGFTLDAAENLYGTASEGGSQDLSCYPDGCGTVFQLKRTHSGFVFYPLYVYQDRTDGEEPEAPVTIARDGSLYRSVAVGGSAGCGAIVRLQPPPTACGSFSCPWRKTEIYPFQGGDACDFSGTLVFDQSGNLYGTTRNEDGRGYGNVWELSPCKAAGRKQFSTISICKMGMAYFPSMVESLSIVPAISTGRPRAVATSIAWLITVAAWCSN